MKTALVFLLLSSLCARRAASVFEVYSQTVCIKTARRSGLTEASIGALLAHEQIGRRVV